MGSNLLLAYMLVPYYFGLTSLVSAFIIGFILLSDFNINESIVRSNRGTSKVFYNTVWTIGLIRGLVLFVAVYFSAPYIADFYSQPLLTELLRFSGFTLIFSGFTSTSITLLNRELQIRPIIILEIVASTVCAVVMVVWAYMDPSPLALVSGSISAEFIKFSFSYIVFPQHRNQFCFDRSSLLEVFHFGKWIFLSTTFTFFATQFDKVILGRLLTLHELGLYSIAFSVSSIAYQLFGTLSGKVLFPVFSHFGRDGIEIFRRNLLCIRSLLMPIILFICSVFLSVIPSFFLIYEEEYHDVGRICQYFMLVVWIGLIQECLIKAPLALGMAKIQALFSLANAGFRIIFSILGFLYAGLEGFIIGMAFGSFLGYSVIHVWARSINIYILKSDLLYTAIIILIFLINIFLSPYLAQGAYVQLLWSAIFTVISILALATWAKIRFGFKLKQLATYIGS